MRIVGIDESGRGPVLGPLVVCGYMIEEKDREKLKEIGVRDSKMLSPEKREEIFSRIVKVSDVYSLAIASAEEIDSYVNEKKLNVLEIKKMQEIINKLKPDKAIIDSPERNTKRFKNKIKEGLRFECEIIAENYADRKYVEVGAASIIAKITREKEIKELHKKYGNFGSGYTSDEETVEFLKSWLKKNKKLPDFARKSWITSRMLLKDATQTRLGCFEGFGD